MKKKTSAAKEQVTPNYEQILYTPDRVEKWLKGELTLQQLTAVSGPEMLQMAMVGFRMYEQGRFAEAKVVFQGLVTLDPKESYFLTALGAVHMAEEELEDALRCLDLAVIANAKDLAAHVNRGEVHLRLGHLLEAVADFKMAVELDPTASDALTVRAKVLAAAAIESIEAAREGEKPRVAAAAAAHAAK